jgi:hypothetical protein
VNEVDFIQSIWGVRVGFVTFWSLPTFNSSDMILCKPTISDLIKIHLAIFGDYTKNYAEKQIMRYLAEAIIIGFLFGRCPFRNP